MQIDADSREDYFSAAGSREAELRLMDALIQEHAPALTPTLSGELGARMLGYGEQPYRSKSMKEPSVWPVVALAAQKRYVSLYVCAVVDGEYLAERHASELGTVNCGKSCIRFTKVDRLNLETLKKILVEVNDRYVAGEKLYGV
ncbi:MAG TPA: DUF1801 domain-containing protein [Propionibacteriaceae bacterium]|jgi:hypothetical protein|nr:DUF1801 domain-containing protein [Propionibacteriaceae bacterium]